MGTAGVSSYEISLEKQEVVVNGSIGYDALLEKIKKTGKEVGGVGCLGGAWIADGWAPAGPLWADDCLRLVYTQGRVLRVPV